MQSGWRRKLLLSLTFGALVFLALSVYADIGALIAAFGRFDWRIAPLVVACTLVNYVFRYWKWEYYTDRLGISPARTTNLIIFFSAFTMAVTPGKLGEVLKSYLLKQVNGTPISRSAPIVIAERLTDFLGLVVLLLAGAAVFDISRPLVATFTMFFIGATILLAWRRGALWMLGVVGRLPVIRRFAGLAAEAYESIHVLLRPRPLFAAVSLSVISWGFEAYGYYLILHTFGAPPSPLKAMFIYAFSIVVGAVSMLPGGLGSTEGSLTGLALLAGAAKEVAVASTFIIRIATLWFAVIIGVIVTIALHRRLHVAIETIQLDTVRE